jgi:mRNA interferase RelE/StbE
MMSVVRATPTFGRAVKKLHARDKKAVDDAVREIIKAPKIGEEKKGDLAGVQLEPDAIVLLSLGSHENFYRNLKR